MLTINDLKTGTKLQINGEPYLVLKSEHTHLGRGGASVRVKVRNLLNGKVLEKVYKPGDRFEEADLKRSQASFLYAQGDEYYFMSEETYDQFFLSKKQLGLGSQLLKEGQIVDVLHFREAPISVSLPPKINLRVTQSPPGIRGDTAQGSVTKIVTLETGLQIQAPLFIKEGDTVKINTETGEYVERA